MSSFVSVAYPRTPDIKFDMSYYLSTHMPLVVKNWEKHGLVRWEIIQHHESSPYAVQALLYFKDEGAFDKAAAEDREEPFGDIPNFTNAKPEVWKGTRKADWAA